MAKTKRRLARSPMDEDALTVIEETFGLDRGGAEAFSLLIGAMATFKQGESFDERLLSNLGALLGYPGVAEAAAQLAQVSEPDLHDLVVRVAEGAAVGHRAGALTVLAFCEEAEGNVLGAQAKVAKALADDAEFYPALYEAALYASERGDATTALDLFKRAGYESDEPMVDLIRSFARPPRAAVARNAPCPCGSGKKHKLCCLRATAHPLERRAEWLVFKIATWAIRDSATTLMADLASDLFDDDADPDEVLDFAAGDSAILDVALFDFGLMLEYLETRGVLLPDDERDLAESWLDTERSAYEVVGVSVRRGYTVRDLISGREVAIDDPVEWDLYEPLDTVFGRVVPNGQGHMFFPPPTLVPRTRRPSLVAMLQEGGEWEDIAEWRRLLPKRPLVTNTEGEDFVVCTATYRIPDEADARAALGAVLREDSDGTFVWDVMLDDQMCLRGSVLVADGVVELATNSVARFERLKKLVESSIPGSSLLSEEHENVDDLMARTADRPNLQVASAPEELVALDAYIAEYEDRWIDLSIPALRGATPREAADDPSLRPELDALLDDLEWRARHHNGQGRAMDARRIRSLLGI